MTRSTTRKVEFDYDEERIPLSPITSPPLTKRQEQNRAAQRAFRERRAQTLKEMEIRLRNLEKMFEELSRNIGKIGSIEKEILKLKETINNLTTTVDAISIPSWTVPTSEEVKPIETHDIGSVLNALRPSSTDPTLLSNQ